MDKKLFDLIGNGSNAAVLAEVSETARMVAARFDSKQFLFVCEEVVDIYEGRCPEYKACNTEYHDLDHVLQVTLATARIAHGTHMAGRTIDDFDLLLVLVLAMLHDIGYIQPAIDEQGTGAKHTLEHVDRSIDFAKGYLVRKGFSGEDVQAGIEIIKATDISVRIGEMHFQSDKTELLAKMMAAGDIVAQMADRFYLEKLLLLYREFEEGKVPGFQSEFDLLSKTIGFYDFARNRMDSDLGGYRKNLRGHFAARWGIDEDLYQKAIDANISYLKFLLAEKRENYRGMLQRGSIVRNLESRERIPNVV